MIQTHDPDHVQNPLAERLATTTLLALFFYLLLVIALDATLAGVALNLRNVLLLFLVAAVGLRFGIHRVAKRGLISRGGLLNVSLLSSALVISFLAVDLGVSAYLGLTAPDTDLEALASSDRNASVGEWYPRVYYPTPKNFRLHKPGFSITGDHYGVFYSPTMLGSPTLVKSVLERRHVSIHINELGFRESSPIDSCKIFTLGDSFTFGWGVSEGEAWPDLLEREIGACVYNLGVHDASPKEELLLLEYLFARPVLPAPERLIWTIYEGNDLEDSYAEWAPTHSQGRVRQATKGTIIESLRGLLYRVRTQSLVHRFRTGEIRLLSPARRRQEAARYMVDGVRLVNPLFHSPRFGFMLLHWPYLSRAAQPEEYVLQHPHRRDLDELFARMDRLSDSLQFRVTVAIMPTSVRLYAPYIGLTPAPAAEPHFLNYVERLARAKDFDVINFYSALGPYAKTELLYFRDDDHLNPRGNEVVARLLANHLEELGYGSQ